MYSRLQSRQHTHISFAISLFLHFMIVFVVSINLPRWYEPLPPMDAIFAEPIDIELNSQLIHMTDVKKTISRENTQAKRYQRHVSPALQVSPKASVAQMDRMSQPVPMMSNPLSTEARLLPTSDASLTEGFKEGWRSWESAGEPLGIEAESPQSPTVEIKRGFSQKQKTPTQKTQAEGDAAPSLSRDAQIGSVLQVIAGNIVSGTGPPTVDIVFLLDASGSMGDNIRAVGNHLIAMVETFKEKQLDFTMGVVTFKYSALVFPQTKDYQKYERLLENVKCGGDERAYDAIIKSIARVKFRSVARRRFILVTDEPCKGSYTIRDVLKRCREAQITLDVIGINQSLQKYLARQTGGAWFPIPGS